MEQHEMPQGNPAKENFSQNIADASGVKAFVPQGYETKLKIRIVGAKAGSLKRMTFCKPRKGADRRDTEPLSLPPSILTRFDEINRKVITYLAQSPANAEAFLSNPVDTLQKAGVELPRSEQKQIHRSFKELEASLLVAPGVSLTALTVEADSKATVRKIASVSNTGNHDCNCQH